MASVIKKAKKAQAAGNLSPLTGSPFLSPELQGQASDILSLQGKIGEGGLGDFVENVGNLAKTGKAFKATAKAEIGRKKSEFEARRKETTRFRTGRSSTIFAGGQPTISSQQGTASTLLGL